MDNNDKEFLEEVREHIEHHEDDVAEHIERHITSHLSGLSGVIVDYERHSRRRSWIVSILTGTLIITNIILILILGGTECLNWYGTF